jgi:hypothetical protein
MICLSTFQNQQLLERAAGAMPVLRNHRFATVPVVSFLERQRTAA